MHRDLIRCYVRNWRRDYAVLYTYLSRYVAFAVFAAAIVACGVQSVRYAHTAIAAAMMVPFGCCLIAPAITDIVGHRAHQRGYTRSLAERFAPLIADLDTIADLSSRFDPFDVSVEPNADWQAWCPRMAEWRGGDSDVWTLDVIPVIFVSNTTPRSYVVGRSNFYFIAFGPRAHCIAIGSQLPFEYIGTQIEVVERFPIRLFGCVGFRGDLILPDDQTSG